MKKILFLLVCIISSVFTACNDDDNVVDCAAQYPFETNLFISLETGDMIRFAPESAQLYYNYQIFEDSISSDITVAVKYKYKIPYFLFDESEENMKIVEELNLKSIQVADTSGLNVTYRDGSVVYFEEYAKVGM